MFRASLAHHQEFRNCVCSQVSHSIILDYVCCLSCAVSAQVFVGPGMVCVGCPLGGVRYSAVTLAPLLIDDLLEGWL